MRRLPVGLGVLAAIAAASMATAAPALAWKPTCSAATPSTELLWPPNHQFQLVTINNVVSPDGRPVTITIKNVWQDERLDALGDGSFEPDAMWSDTPGSVFLRAERSGLGDGRVYRIRFRADDSIGRHCAGIVTVGVPHDQGPNADPPVDSGLWVRSFGPKVQPVV
jgi:hypothetical protein